jgi:hypothetical protein
MIGFITTEETATAILASIRESFAARGYPPFWSPGVYPIYSGPHAGGTFIPAGDDMFECPLMLNPLRRPMDYPEFAQFIEALGGLEARVEIEPADIKAPSDEL